MKKFITLSIMAFALLAFAVAPAFAGPSCSADKTVKADKASSSSSCSSSSKVNATKASAKAECTPEDMAACAKAMNLSVEDCKKMCGPDGKMTMHKISINGMTCGGCESSVTKAIEGVSGVQKVVSISHKDASAVVCVDKSNTCLTTLTKAITDKGFKAEIIPAVAKISSTSNVSKASATSCSKTCSSKEKAACESKKAEKKAEGTN